MSSTARPPKPKRKAHLRGIKALFSAGRWQWRACIKRDGKQKVGPLRGTQEAAHADFLELSQLAPAHGGKNLAAKTLGPALDAWYEEKAKTSTDQYLKTLGSHRKYILRAWGERVHLGAITGQHLQDYVDGAIGRGRNANTIRKDLGILRTLFESAEIAMPKGFKVPKAPRPETHFLEPDELVEVVERIRAWRGRDKWGREIRLTWQERDASIVKFVGCTGIRHNEFLRLRVEDINTRRRTIRVINNKNGGQVETVLYAEFLDADVQTLIDNAMPDGRLIQASRSLEDLWTRWRERLGLKHFNGRVLRHTEATRVLLDTGDLAAAQQRLRHSSIVTTARYVHVVQEQLKRSLEIQGERWGHPRPSKD